MERNVHSRVLEASPEAIAPWIERCWSGTEQDPFPRELVRTWRRNPRPHPAQALVPGVTWLGHGRFAFKLVEWTGRRWRVETDGGWAWHGFDLEPTPTGTRVTHTLEIQPRGMLRIVWPLVIRPLHDWVVETLLERLDVAVRTGALPEKAERDAAPWQRLFV